jgi:trigger factor
MLSDTLNKYIDDEKLEVLGQPLPQFDGDKHYNWDFTDNFEFNYELGLAPDLRLTFRRLIKLANM